MHLTTTGRSGDETARLLIWDSEARAGVYSIYSVFPKLAWQRVITSQIFCSSCVLILRS